MSEHDASRSSNDERAGERRRGDLRELAELRAEVEHLRRRLSETPGHGGVDARLADAESRLASVTAQNE